MKPYKYFTENRETPSFEKVNELGKTLSNGGMVLSDNLTAFGKSGKRYPSFTP